MISAHQRGVGHPWNVVEPYRFGGQEGGGHLGQGCVLGTADADVTSELGAPCDSNHVIVTRR